MAPDGQTTQRGGGQPVGNTPARRARCTAVAAALLWLPLALAGCAGGERADRCRIRVIGPEKVDLRPGAVDLAYRVQGEAGSPAVASLVAKVAPQNFITGPGVQVGPGPFVAVVELKLTGRPPELLALLEVGATRCRATVKLPR